MSSSSPSPARVPNTVAVSRLNLPCRFVTGRIIDVQGGGPERPVYCDAHGTNLTLPRAISGKGQQPIDPEFVRCDAHAGRIDQHTTSSHIWKGVTPEEVDTLRGDAALTSA